MTGKLKHYLRATTAISEEQLSEVASCFKVKKVKKNTVLLSEGEVCKELYLVSSGVIRTYYLTGQGQEKTRYIALEGSAATAIASFISQQASFEFVDALEDSVLFSISHADFYRLVKEIPGWASFYQKLLETAYLFQNRKIADLVTLSAKERYQQILEERPVLVQRLSNKTLASYLDLSQETLSRIKSR